MAQSKYGDISQRTGTYAMVKMLSHAEPILVLSKFAQNKPLPKNKADNAKFRRPVPFAKATTPLTEGVTPTAQQMSYEDVPVTIKQYGAVAEITDVVQDLCEDPVLNDASMLSGEQAAETIEDIVWGVIKAGTNVFYNNKAHTLRTDVNGAITLDRQRAITRSLRDQRGKAITTMLDSSPNYATKAIEGGFIGFAHTDQEADIRNLPGFIPVADYGSRKPLCAEEVGSVENVRYILSPLLSPFDDAGATASGTGMKTSGTKVDVYPVVYVAKEAYGVVPLKGANAITPSVINPGTPSKSDPLGQKGFVGWKTYFAAVRLNEAWMARLEVGATDL